MCGLNDICRSITACFISLATWLSRWCRLVRFTTFRTFSFAAVGLVVARLAAIRIRIIIILVTVLRLLWFNSWIGRPRCLGRHRLLLWFGLRICIFTCFAVFDKSFDPGIFVCSSALVIFCTSLCLLLCLTSACLGRSISRRGRINR